MDESTYLTGSRCLAMPEEEEEEASRVASLIATQAEEEPVRRAGPQEQRRLVDSTAYH
jgi:hypothetical protein